MHFIRRWKSNILKDSQLPDDIIIAPREQCQSCNSPSGPKFALTTLRDTIPILRANTTLTQLDRTLTKANIEHAQSEGRLLDQEILHVQQSLEKLQRRRDALRRFEELEQSMLSPCRRVPLEILQYIFLLANTEDSLRDARVAITQVCSYWRSVALSSAPLWARIRICRSSYLKRSNTYNAKYGRYIEDCLRFSKGMPLTLQLGWGVTPGLLGSSCVKALGRNAYRWKDVVIVEGKLAIALFASIPKGTSVDHLESLNLRELTKAVSIASAPKLHTVMISGHPIHNHQVTINFAPSLKTIVASRISLVTKSLRRVDFSQTTYFELNIMEDFQPNEVISVLERLTNLSTFKCYGTGTIGTCTKSIKLPCLETLNIDCLMMENILDRLTTPRLKNLFVGGHYRHEQNTVQQLARRSKCLLDKLKMSPDGFDETFLILEFANVKTLIWNDPQDIEQSLVWLAYQGYPSTDDVFPRLEALFITGLFRPTENDWWEVQDLIDMLKSRMGAPGTDSAERCYMKYVRLNVTAFKTGQEDFILLKNFVQSEFVRSSGATMDLWIDGTLHVTTSEGWSRSVT